MTLPPFLHAQPEGVLLRVKVQPRASKNAIGEVLGNELKITVTAPPVDSAANQALLCLLADTLDCPRGAVQVVRGQASRHKHVLIHGLSANDVVAKLAR
jgi:uncharacterized protein (TIGR00251 family)